MLVQLQDVTHNNFYRRIDVAFTEAIYAMCLPYQIVLVLTDDNYENEIPLSRVCVPDLL